MKPGDKFPWTPDAPYDPKLVKIAMGMRGTHRLANRKGDSAASKVARATLRAVEERDAREADPFEQARRYLGRLGVVVFTMAVYDPKFDGSVLGPVKLAQMIDAAPWRVGKREVPDRAAVMAIARKAGWRG